MNSSTIIRDYLFLKYRDDLDFKYTWDSIRLCKFLFFQQGVSINEKLLQGQTALHIAAMCNDEELASFLLKNSADPNIKNLDNNTPLHPAIKNNNLTIVKLLIDNGAQVELPYSNGETGYMLAISSNNTSMIKYFLSDKNCQKSINKHVMYNGLEFGPLKFAVALLNVEIVELLLRKENYQLLNEPKENILFNLLCSKVHDTPDNMMKFRKIAKLFSRSGIDTNAKDKDGISLLQWAIVQRNDQMVEMLVKSGCNINFLCPESATPLMAVVGICVTCESNNDISKWKKILEILLQYGADYMHRDNTGSNAYTFLFAQFIPVRTELIRLFWKYGCPYDLPVLSHRETLTISYLEKEFLDDIYPQELLFEGIQCNNKNTVEKALGLGATVKGTSMKIKYPLHFVVNNNFTDVAEILLQNGIQVNKLNDKQETALQLALDQKNIKMCRMLLQHGAYTNYEAEIMKLCNNRRKDIKMKTLLQSILSGFNLAKKGDEAVIDMLDNLLDKDMDMFLVLINALDKHKRSLMATAMYYKHGAIAEKIMERRLKYKIKNKK